MVPVTDILLLVNLMPITMTVTGNGHLPITDDGSLVTQHW